MLDETWRWQAHVELAGLLLHCPGGAQAGDGSTPDAVNSAAMSSGSLPEARSAIAAAVELGREADTKGLGRDPSDAVDAASVAAYRRLAGDLAEVLASAEAAAAEGREGDAPG